jgi:molybdopterin-guanine dinucleotide biosynthesis protein A
MEDRKVTEKVAFVGAVLTGGSSRRMGRDKALVPVGETPMALRVAHSMLEAGAEEVFAVGGDAKALGTLGLRFVPDEFPHEGPLGGIISALRASSEAVVVVTACDMPWIRSEHVSTLVGALGTKDVVMSAADGQAQPLHAVWRRSSLDKLEQAFLIGERSPQRAIRGLHFAVVDFGAGTWSIDLDTPEEVVSTDTTKT